MRKSFLVAVLLSTTSAFAANSLHIQTHGLNSPKTTDLLIRVTAFCVKDSFETSIVTQQKENLSSVRVGDALNIEIPEVSCARKERPRTSLVVNEVSLISRSQSDFNSLGSDLQISVVNPPALPEQRASGSGIVYPDLRNEPAGTERSFVRSVTYSTNGQALRGSVLANGDAVLLHGKLEAPIAFEVEETTKVTTVTRDKRAGVLR